MKQIIFLIFLVIGMNAEFIPKKSLKERQELLKTQVLSSSWFRKRGVQFENHAQTKINKTKRALNNNSSKSSKRGYYENMFNSVIGY